MHGNDQMTFLRNHTDDYIWNTKSLHLVICLHSLDDDTMIRCVVFADSDAAAEHNHLLQPGCWSEDWTLLLTLFQGKFAQKSMLTHLTSFLIWKNWVSFVLVYFHGTPSHCTCFKNEFLLNSFIPILSKSIYNVSSYIYEGKNIQFLQLCCQSSSWCD